MRNAAIFALLLLGCGEPPGESATAPASKAPASKAPAPPGAALESVPLPSRAQVPGPRFVELPAAATGLNFRHQWTDVPEHQQQFTGPFAGGGVALGDYDGDGRPDVFLTRPLGGGRLYRNLGDFKFQDVTEAVGIADDGWTTGPSFVDLDGDGDLDLVVGRFDAPNRVYVNDGGRFTERAAALGLDYSGATVAMAFADYDRDGDLDAYLLTYRRTPPKDMKGEATLVDGKPVPPPEHREWVGFLMRPGQPVTINAGQRDRLYRNDGDRFTDVTASAGIAETYEMGLSARFWDADADGWPDLYVANDFFGADRFYKNQRGHFVEVTGDAVPHTPWFSMGADAADIDNDGRLDLFVADMAGTNHYKQKLSMGDMNDDGWFLEFAQPPQYMRNALFLNTGTPRFREVAQLAGLASTDWTWTPRFADLDEDGRVDLFVSNGMTRDFSDSDIRQKLKDGGRWDRLDLGFWLAQPERKEPNLTFRNRGELKFESVGEDWGLGEESISFGAALGDLDGDGDLDLMTNDFQRTPRVYRNQSSDGHRVRVRLIGAEKNSWAVGARVLVTTAAGTQIRELASSGGFMSANEPLLHFGLGAQARLSALEVRWPSGRTQRFTDLAADMLYTVREPPSGPKRSAPPLGPTVFERSDAPGPPHAERPFDDFAAQPLLPNRLSALGPGLAWGDLDGDGDFDLWRGGAAGQPGVLYRNDGGTLSPMDMPADAAAEDMGGLWFDADGDGDQDLFVVSGGVEAPIGDVAYRDRLYLNEGGALTRASAAIPDLRDSGGPAAASDFDGDGDLDLFVGGRVVPGAYPTAPNSRLLRNDAGRFVDVTDTLAKGLRTAGMITGAVWSDADGDGQTDLLLATEWGPIQMWRNTGGRLVDGTRDAGLDVHRGWWSSLNAADVDGDGDMDLIAGNFGRNSKYHLSDDHPALLYYGPLGADGANHLVEAGYEGDTLFPVRGRSCSSDAMPELATRYRTFGDFAKASVGDIYGAALDKAQKFEADLLDSGVWLNEGGQFRFQALPVLAQIAPTYGIGVLDFDADGKPDLLLAQNFFGPQRESGRMGGSIGLLLRGNGDGTFAAVPADESGVVIPEDATAVAVGPLDEDGWPDVVVAINGGPIGLLRHGGRGMGAVHAVRLEGAQRVGARVELVTSGGSRTAEVRAGGGYLSQDAPVLHFGLGSATARSVRVRWPDGTLQEAPATGRTTTITRR